MKGDNEVVVTLREELSAQREQLERMTQLMERGNQLLEIEKGERQRVEAMKKMRAIGALPMAERVEEIRKLDIKGRRQFWPLCNLSQPEMLATLRAMDPELQRAMVAMLPPALHDDLAIASNPAPARIVALLSPNCGISKIDATRIPAGADGRKYTGVQFDTQAVHVELKSTWQARLHIDQQIAHAIARGQITVRDMTDDESRRHSLLEASEGTRRLELVL